MYFQLQVIKFSWLGNIVIVKYSNSVEVYWIKISSSSSSRSNLFSLERKLVARCVAFLNTAINLF